VLRSPARVDGAGPPPGGDPSREHPAGDPQFDRARHFLPHGRERPRGSRGKGTVFSPRAGDPEARAGAHHRGDVRAGVTGTRATSARIHFSSDAPKTYRPRLHTYAQRRDGTLPSGGLPWRKRRWAVSRTSRPTRSTSKSVA